MVTLFHDMMHTKIEIYVDDMIAKSRQGEDHVGVLQKLFKRLRKFKLCLNPTKCVFGTRSGKLLGFMVSNNGIEIDPSKVKAICDLRSSTTTKEVHSLMGWLNYVARFICQLSETTKPFFKFLKKNAKIEWDIKYLLEKPALVGKLANEQILISEFDVQSLGQKSIKGRAIANMLAESSERSRASDEGSDAEERILLVSSDKWTMYFDGAINLARSGTRAVLISPYGQHYPVAAKLMFPCTNNIAEYEACILDLQAAIDMKIRKMQVYGDSTLIILQTKGEWRTQDSKLIPYHEFLGELTEEFQEIAFEYLLRSQNQFDDALATLSSMLQVAGGLDIEPLRIEIFRRPAYCMTIEEEPDGQPWYHDILKYLQNGEFPEGSEAADIKHLIKLALKFFASGDILYKRSFDSTLLRCVDAKEADRLMKEIHEGECGPI
ncbi:uncharacterized protein LOC120287482 [Eucalyptus grandis]|uniref:uncharacterized protein LOC120287482 n=1 Tax=Eucalyptus grandis TaxID=71139 RepID=UPI00192EA1C9|nr:uncharacterized protein LOC120287482 [Eucalyptus grandis]